MVAEKLRQTIRELERRLEAKEDQIQDALTQRPFENAKDNATASPMVKTIQFLKKKLAEKDQRIGELEQKVGAG